MMRVIDLRGSAGLPAGLSAGSLPRSVADPAEIEHIVKPVIAEVAERGEAAVLGWGAKFDGVTPPSLRVPSSVIEAAVAGLDNRLKAALELAIDRVRQVHIAQLPVESKLVLAAGASVTNVWKPVGRVGLYVPGGRAVYPSSVVMNVVPAQVAGVDSIAVTSPPRIDHGGWPHPAILAAAGLLGVDEIYAAGGAQAIAMFAFGTLGDTSDCEPVDLITGPGNKYVAAAKRMLSGRIGIDSDAGPTEIAILADADADPSFIAADLISQAEHDELAASVLVTDSLELVSAVRLELDTQVAATKHVERIRAALSGAQSAIVLVDDIDQGVRVINEYAAEHLEILVKKPRAVAARIDNAGAIFIGGYSPVSLGDYLAGSNHVLPTAGSARHSAGLSALTFLRCVQVIEYDAAALREASAAVNDLALAEDLPAHAAAVRVRGDIS